MDDTMATLSSSPQAAGEFDVYCLTKPKHPVHGGEQSETEGQVPPCRQDEGSERCPSALTYHDVVQQLCGGGDELFSPYRSCTRAQLLQVHAYWVAVPKPTTVRASCGAIPQVKSSSMPSLDMRSEGGEATVMPAGVSGVTWSCPDAERRASCATASPPASTPPFACVVGVVWVRLSSVSRASLAARCRFPRGAQRNRRRNLGEVSAALHSTPSTGPAVEGYLQVVLTYPRYRRRGLAFWLLSRCLASKVVSSGIFLSDGEDGAAYRVQRWHLHTMVATPSTPPPGKRPRAARADPLHLDNDNGRAEISSIAATLAMYHRLGFEERRYLHRYYAGERDAVELVKECPCEWSTTAPSQ